MDILLPDALVPEAVGWLRSRLSVEYCPDPANDLSSLRKVGYKTQGIVFPRQTLATRKLLDFLPKLKALGRLHVGTDNSDLEACKERGIKVVHASSANVRSNAEYLLGSLLMLYRRGLVSSLMGRHNPNPGWDVNCTAVRSLFSGWHPPVTRWPTCLTAWACA